MRANRLLLAALLISFAGRRESEACSCDQNPPCAAAWRADAVFVGTIVERTQEPLGGTLSWTVHHVAVNQRLLGSIEPFVTLLPAATRPTAERIEASKAHNDALHLESSCDYTFEAGRQYVIYARRTDDGRWMTSACSGTKPIERATADLEYIAGIPVAAATGRVYGRIEKMVVDSANVTETAVVPASGISVELAGGSSRLRTSTDSQGQLDVQVPAGEYTIFPVVPETIRVYGSPFKARVPARGCVPVYFSITANGRIEGRVIEADGSPAARTSVTVVPADLPPGQRPDSSRIAPSAPPTSTVNSTSMPSCLAVM
jgi:hypothetical protein